MASSCRASAAARPVRQVLSSISRTSWQHWSRASGRQKMPQVASVGAPHSMTCTGVAKPARLLGPSALVRACGMSQA
eukprot:scaffold1768_cov116-Isochrysis_galbana.AAC.7